MPKYLVTGAYTADGVKGLLKDGGTKRRAAADELVKSLGGQLEAMYFCAAGDSDIVLIADFPDHASVAATGLVTRAAGALTTGRSMLLVTPEEMDGVAQKTVSYQPPAQSSASVTSIRTRRTP